MPKQKAFQKIQIRVVRELEKKFSGKQVVFIGERKILPKPQRKARNPLKQKRPRSRTLTAVYDAILEDLVFPAEIVGKRVRVKLDGKQLIKVHLDKNQQTTIEHKVSPAGGGRGSLEWNSSQRFCVICNLPQSECECQKKRIVILYLSR